MKKVLTFTLVMLVNACGSARRVQSPVFRAVPDSRVAERMDVACPDEEEVSYSCSRKMPPTIGDALDEQIEHMRESMDMYNDVMNAEPYTVLKSSIGDFLDVLQRIDLGVIRISKQDRQEALMMMKQVDSLMRQYDELRTRTGFYDKNTDACRELLLRDIQYFKSAFGKYSSLH
jgi:hypothetical protein